MTCVAKEDDEFRSETALHARFREAVLNLRAGIVTPFPYGTIPP